MEVDKKMKNERKRINLSTKESLEYEKEPKRKEMSLLSPQNSSYCCKTKEKVEESTGGKIDAEYSDSDEESLNSVLEAVKRIKIKQPIYMYMIKTKESGLNAVDTKFSDVAFATYFSPEIHVMSTNGDIVSEERHKCKRRYINTEIEKFECSQKFVEIKVLHHPADVTALNYTEGNLLLSCSLDGTVKAWSRNYQLVYSFCDNMTSLSDINASSRNDYFATSSLDVLSFENNSLVSGASLFSYSRKYPIMSFLGHSAGIQCVRFHPNGMYLATAAKDNTIKMWSTSSAKPVRTFQEECKWDGNWRKLAFSPDGKYLASTCFGSVKIWDIASGHLVNTLGDINPNHSLLNICYNEFGNKLAAGGSDKELKIWNIEDCGLGSSSVSKYDAELMECNVLDQAILKITCVGNIFSCLSVVTNHKE